jgi:hypothetical protein
MSTANEMDERAILLSLMPCVPSATVLFVTSPSGMRSVVATPAEPAVAVPDYLNAGYEVRMFPENGRGWSWLEKASTS